MKILIAEDEGVIAISLYRVLNELGYAPLEPATSSTEALSIIENEQPELAIVDIHLGEYFSGFKVAKKLQESNIPFIFLTALFDKQVIEEAKKYDPLAYLVKPFTKENLFATIELSALQHKKQSPVAESNIVSLKDGNQIIKIDTALVSFLAAENKYIYIHFSTGKKQLIRNSFSEIIELLQIPTLIQVHKSYAINTNYITALKYDELFVGDIRIPIGRAYRDNLISAQNKD